MTHNPYAPPTANVEGQPAVTPASTPLAGPLYSPNQIAVASFLGSPFAAAWFAATNFRSLAQPLNARQTLLWGAIATFVVVGIAFVLPDRTPNSILPLAYSFAIRAIAEMKFADVIKDHQSAGGRLASWWRVIGISLLFTLAVVALIIAVAYLLIEFGVIAE